MQNPEEKVALQAVEFWSTVCDEEAELMYEAQEVRYAQLLRRQVRVTDHRNALHTG